MLEYKVVAQRTDAHGSTARCKDAEIILDTDVQGRPDAFNPAELLLAAVAACMIKGTERVAPMNHFVFRGVEVRLHGIRQDSYGVDRTAVFIDVRGAEEFSKRTIPRARNLRPDTLGATIKTMMSGQLKDAPLPLDDINRRIVLVGADGSQSREMADAMSTRPWHNVAYYSGTIDTLMLGRS